jgi:hypothetical protein
MLANKIMNSSPIDLVEEERHILIPRLICSKFVNEFRSLTSGKNIFNEFTNTFTKEIVKYYNDPDVKTLDDLYLTGQTLDFFYKCFHERFGKGAPELLRDFDKFMEMTSINIAKKWIQSVV